MALSDNEAFSKIEQEFETYRAQKSRRVGGPERRILQNLAMYVGEQWVWFERGSLRNKRPRVDENGKITEVNLVFNLIQKAHEDIYGRLTSSEPEWRAWPDSMDAAKMAKAEFATKANRAAMERLDEDYLRWQRWFWNMMGGYWVEHTPWRPDMHVDSVPQRGPDGQPMYEHIPTGEVVPADSYMAMVAPPEGQEKKALPEHFKPAMELEEVGDFGADVRGGLNVFAPNSIKTVDDLQPGQSIMTADVRMLSWAKKTWPEADFSEIKEQTNINILTTTISESVSFSNTSLRDLIPVVQGSNDEDDPKMLVVVERYEPVSSEFPPGWSMENDASTGMGFMPAPNEDFAHGGRYTVFSPEQGILRDGEIPYADGIPMTDGHWNVSAANFHSPDWCTKLNGPQKSINTLASQMRMLENARIFDPILKEEGLVPPESDSPGYWDGGIADGVPQAQRLGGDSIPSHYPKSLEALIKMFDRLSGRDSLFQEEGFPGQIRGTGAVQKLQDIQDSQWGPKLRHYYAQVGKVYHRRLNRMKQFYPPIRSMKMTDSTGKVEVLEFHTDEILKSGVDYYISVEPSSIMPETRRDRYARVQEMLNSPLQGLYLDQVTGQLDWNAIASELQFGDYKGREAVIAQQMQFAKSVLSAIKEGRAVPPVMPFQPHGIFITEFEAEMNDDDFWVMLSEETRTAMFQRYQEHQQVLAQQQQQQQQAVIDEETASMIRQAVQQSTAKVQAEVTEATFTQLRSLAQTDPQALQQLLFAGGEEQPMPPAPPPGQEPF